MARLSTVAGGGLFATTVLFGVGGFSPPASAVGVSCIGSSMSDGFGNMCVSLGGDAYAGAGNATTGSIAATGNFAQTGMSGDAYAGAANSALGGNVTANDDTADSTSGDATAGVDNFAIDGNVTANHDTAIAISSDGGTANGTANGNGGFAFTEANGPTAVATATATSVSTSAGVNSRAIATNNSGQVSASFGGYTVSLDSAPAAALLVVLFA